MNEARPREARPQAAAAAVVAAATVAVAAADMAAAVVAADMAAAIVDRAKRPIQLFAAKAPASTARRFLLIPFREAAVKCR